MTIAWLGSETGGGTVIRASSARTSAWMRVVVAGPWLALALVTTNPVRANGWEHHAIPFDVLVRALDSDVAEYRARAAISLGIRREPRGVEPLLALLTRPEIARRVRNAVYDALGRIGDARATPALVSALNDEREEDMRGDAAAALGAIGAPDALPHLLAAFDREMFPVKVRIVEALGAFPRKESIALLSRLALDTANTSLRSRAIRALGETRSDAAVKTLLAALARAPTDRARGEIVDALGRIGAPASREPLSRLLDATPGEDLRARVAVALGAVVDGSAAPTLIDMLADPSLGVRFFAVGALGRIAALTATQPLRNLYLRVADSHREHDAGQVVADGARYLAELELQQAIVRALMTIDPPKGLPVFLDAAEPRPFPRDSALGLAFNQRIYALRRLGIVGLGYTESAAAAAYLAEGPLNDADYRLRAAAVRSLGVLGRPGVMTTAVRMLDDSHPEVRWTAASVLGRLGDGAAVGALVKRLADRHTEVRGQAALSLGYLRAAEAREALAASARDDESEKVRAAAHQALHLIEGG